MARWFFAVLHLLFEAQAAHRDARVRFLKLEVEILRAKLSGNRVIPGPTDRARLLAIGQELDHDVKDVIGIVKWPTYQRWLRERHAGRKVKRPGRPRITAVRRRLVIRFARENLGWGYRRILGELHKLHLPVGRSSIRRILYDEGIFPPPSRARHASATETPWSKFIRLHMNTLVACDFFAKRVLTPFGVRTAYCLFFIHLASRRVFVCPSTYHPHKRWMAQQARNAQMSLDEQGIEARFLLRDRDTKFAPAFDAVFRSSGTRIVRTPVQAPNANAFAEAWIGAMKRECLNHFMCFSRSHLDHILEEYARFYNHHRPHQGVGNRTLAPSPRDGPELGIPMGPPAIRCRRLLGGLLRHYYRDAA